MKAHGEVETLFADYDCLSTTQRQEIEAHAADCPDCAARLADYRRMEQDFAGLRDPWPHPQLHAAIRGGLERPQALGKARRLRPALFLRYAALPLVLLLLVAGWLLLRGSLPWAQIPLSRPGGTAIPAAHSSLVGSFVWQTDGAYGYQMLRPAGWESIGGWTGGRAFVAPGAIGNTDRIGMRVTNLQARKATTEDDAQLQWLVPVFEKDPTLEGWTTNFEKELTHLGWHVDLARSAPDARVYQTFDASLEVRGVWLWGFKVDAGTPLVVYFIAQGAHADMDLLEQEGVIDDLLTMVESARAIPIDPRNVVPSIASVTPIATLPAGHPVPSPAATLTPAATAANPSGSDATVTTPDMRPLQALTRTATYTDSVIGYALDYPAGWRLQAEPGWLVRVTSFDPSSGGSGGLTLGQVKIDLAPDKPGESKTLEQLVAEIEGGGTVTVLREARWELAGGIPAVLIERQSEPAGKTTVLAAVIHGRSLRLTGYGDLTWFGAIARTLRPVSPGDSSQAEAAPTPLRGATFVWPAAGAVSQALSASHSGLDIAGEEGQPILAAAAGRVTFAGWADQDTHPGQGYMVILDHGAGLQTQYAHLKTVGVAPGEQVAQGQQIGEMGSTGNATGPLLHFEVRRGDSAQDPMKLLP